MKGVLAFDLGASSGRAVLTTLENQKMVIKEVNRFSNYAIDSNGSLRWDFEFIMDEIYKSIKKAEQLGDFDSLAIDTWGVDFGLLDKNGELIENPYHYRDKRTNGSFSKIKEIIDPLSLYQKTGIQNMEINTLFQLYTLKNQKPEIYDRAEHLLMMPDLINYYLTGSIKTERTIASTTQLYNPTKQNWDYGLIEKLGFKTSMFPEIIDPGNVVGRLKDSIVEKLGVSNKKVIAIGSHDTASAIVCTPFNNKETLFLSSGTWSLIGTQLNEPNISENTYYNNLSNETGVDNKITLLKNITGLWLIQEAKKQFEREGKNYTFDDISQMAKNAKSVECYFDTDLAELTVPGDIPKRIRLLVKKTNQDIPLSDGEIVRVIYENLALKYRTAYEELCDSVGKYFKDIYIVGGGANADFLSQCTANSLNLNVISGFTEATALGNSLVQMLAMNVIESLDNGKAILANSFETKTFSPEDNENWETKYYNYKQTLSGGVKIGK